MYQRLRTLLPSIQNSDAGHKGGKLEAEIWFTEPPLSPPSVLYPLWSRCLVSIQRVRRVSRASGKNV